MSPVVNICRKLLLDEAGFIVSAELVLISTVGVLGMVAGLTCLRDAMVHEMKDVGDAFTSLDQSYYYPGMHGCRNRCASFCSSWTAGSAYGTCLTGYREWLSTPDFGCLPSEVITPVPEVLPSVENCLTCPPADSHLPAPSAVAPQEVPTTTGCPADSPCPDHNCLGEPCAGAPCPGGVSSAPTVW